MQYNHERVERSRMSKTSQSKKSLLEAADLRLSLGRSEALRPSMIAIL